MFLVHDIKLSLEESLDEDNQLRRKLARYLGVPEDALGDFRIVHESVDARRKSDIRLVYQLAVSLRPGKSLKKDLPRWQPPEEPEIAGGDEVLEDPIGVLGFGPAGMFCALHLARRGYRPLVFERGKSVAQRSRAIEAFWQGGSLDPNNNVQFGEGGAGTFSDGKLTTRSKDPRVGQVLRDFIKAGAPAEIAWRNKPHVGTDLLRDVVKNIRQEIESLGGRVLFDHQITDWQQSGNRITAVEAAGEWWPVSALVLAPGHSARDTYGLLHRQAVAMEAKPFAVGLRIEHRQAALDEAQYGKAASHPKLRAAEYRLASQALGRGVYSFCMCPGGLVVNASSEPDRLCVNGMSYHARDEEMGNSALVVSVTPKDYGSRVLDGVIFQRSLEEAAFTMGGGDYSAPVQNVQDFLKGVASRRLVLTPSVGPAHVAAKLHDLLPGPVTESLRVGLGTFDKKIRGFAQGLFTGVETRTSAPVRILRQETYQAPGLANLYPCGEGAGYAGGIVSAAVDGLRVSEALIQRFASPRD